MADSTPPLNIGYCKKHGRGWSLKARVACPECAEKPAGVAAIGAVVAAFALAGSRTKRCLFGHAHDSAGEAEACPVVYARAANCGCTTFRPGRPGLPCFRVAPDDAGRPVYVSVDWVVVNAAGKVVGLVDYKGSVKRSVRFDKSWSRGKRIVEAEFGVRVVELASARDAYGLRF